MILTPQMYEQPGDAVSAVPTKSLMKFWICFIIFDMLISMRTISFHFKHLLLVVFVPMAFTQHTLNTSSGTPATTIKQAHVITLLKSV